jgi:transcriptional regulator with XRE-family HTH domain
MIERFGEKLRTLRKRRGMTQQELADALGFAAQSYISSLENNEKEPSAELALRISRMFNISTDQLLQDELEV